MAWPVGKKEIEQQPKAQEGMAKEWKRLRDKAVWDESVVKEWHEVVAEARRSKTEVHMGYLFGLCDEKNAELKEGDPNRKYKYRVVFQGNRVVNQNWEAAVFQDLGSSPATMEASRAADAYGFAPGNFAEIADAEQAYIQAEMRGTPTWICLPPEARPPSWSRYRKPVVLMKKAL